MMTMLLLPKSQVDEQVQNGKLEKLVDGERGESKPKRGETHLPFFLSTYTILSPHSRLLSFLSHFLVSLPFSRTFRLPSFLSHFLVSHTLMPARRKLFDNSLLSLHLRTEYSFITFRFPLFSGTFRSQQVLYLLISRQKVTKTFSNLSLVSSQPFPASLVARTGRSTPT